MYLEGEIPVQSGNNPTVVYPSMPYGGGGFGGGYGYGNDLIWIILLFALWGGNGWGNNGNNRGGNCGCGCNGNMLYDINQNTNRGFDNLALNSGIDGVQTALTNGFATVANGFANAEVSRCNAQTNLLQTLSNNQFGLLNTLNNNQNALNSTLTNGFYDMALANQRCCCDQKLLTQDLKSTVISENCADREALSNGIRDIIASNTQNTQAILDKLCQQEIDAKNDLISTLRSQLSMADLRASQVAQTAEIRANNATVANQLVSELRSCPIPAQPVYGSQPIFTCGGNNNCGCGCNGLNVQ